MKIPPLFIGATILFWGYEKNLFILATLLSLLIEGGRFSKTRWQLGKEDYIKISDLTSALLLAAIALIVMNYEARYFLLPVTEWLPLILLPLILAQVYGADEKIIVGTRIGSKKKRHMHRPMDFSFVYAAITLFSAAAANSRHELFFPLFFTLIAWILYANRGKAFSPLTFSIILIPAFFLGFSGIKGLEKGYSNLNQLMMEVWEAHFQSMGADPFKANTSFGDIGRLKLSGKVIMHLQSSEPPPTLLKEAGYNVFSKTIWVNRDREFTAVPMGQDTNWELAAKLDSQPKHLHIEKYFPKNKGLLPKPYGAEEVRGLNIIQLTRNSEGVLRFEEGEILQSYDISYTPGDSSTLAPADYHLFIPELEEAALQKVIDSLNMGVLPAEEQLIRIQRFFQNNFSYGLTTRGSGAYDSPLSNFLLHSKNGHCELFATATALLLRKAGIPSRYVTGYAVSEKTLFGQGYVIRKRHAHAWTEGYINDKWIVIDTTPSNWLGEEQSAASFFEPIRDFFSFIKHQVNLFRARENQTYNLPLSIVVVLLTTFLILRIYRRLNKEKQMEEIKKTRKAFPEQDSPFSMIEEALNNGGVKRRNNEAFHGWIKRINTVQRVDSARLISLHRLHQKLRFDPHGIGEEDMVHLQEGVERWLREHSERN